MAISAKDVKSLRNKSGLGMMECKKALEETNGDMEAAEQMLRQKLKIKMDGRADRESAEGRIGMAITDDRTRGAIVELNTETDFTSGNDTFVEMTSKVALEAVAQPVGDVSTNEVITELVDNIRVTTKENAQFKRGASVGGPGQVVGGYVHHNGKVGALVVCEGPADNALLSDLCMHIVAVTPTPMGVSDDDIDAAIIEKEREIASNEALDSGKPANIVEKIVEGKIRKFFEDNTLLKQPFVKDDKKQVKDILPAGVTVKSFVRYQLGG